MYMKQSDFEIERKFIVTRLPEDLNTEHGELIEQGYICTQEDREVRLRSKSSHYTLTVKEGIGLQRRESEIALDRNQYNMLWPHTLGQRLSKIRYSYYIDNHKVEIDVYLGDLKPLVLAEIEFESIETSQTFDADELDFLGDEVTEMAVYNNLDLVMAKLKAITDKDKK